MRTVLLGVLAAWTGPLFASSAWYADDARLGQIDLASGAVTSPILVGHVHQVRATADGGAWVLTDTDALAVSRAGAI